MVHSVLLFNAIAPYYHYKAPFLERSSCIQQAYLDQLIPLPELSYFPFSCILEKLFDKSIPCFADHYNK